MRLTYHSLAAEDWAFLSRSEPFAPPSLNSEGFIHTTIGEAGVARVLNRFYAEDSRPYVALLIDLDRVTAPWDSSFNETVQAEVPHIHGALNPDAILAVVPVARDAAGAFLPPEPPSI